MNQVSDLIYKVGEYGLLGAAIAHGFNYLLIPGSAVLAVFFGSVFFSIVPLWKNACCAKVFRCYACPYIFMVTAICVFTGFFLACKHVVVEGLQRCGK